MNTFADLTKQIHLINDLILSDMIYEDKGTNEALSFSKHLLSTKYWFARISCANKKRYVLALLEDVRSAWTLSLLLKSIWNCRPKDAVMSVTVRNAWSSYDQVPLDHNRTAQPAPTLAQVMKYDRVWFLTLDSQAQAVVLSELLNVSGGPVMWDVLKRAQFLHERYRTDQLQSLQECILVDDRPPEEGHQKSLPEKGKKEQQNAQKLETFNDLEKGTSPEQMKEAPRPGQAQKELEANLTAWNATIKSMRDNLKLEEIEMTYNDGTKRKIWKVNRSKPEGIETVDFVQLLPSSIGKRIISYLPRSQLADYARVNKYWAYLIEDYRAELAARQKLKADLEKLEDLMIRHDTSIEILAQIGFQPTGPSSQGVTSTGPSMKTRTIQRSLRASEKSTGAFSFRHFLSNKLNKPIMAPKPIKNMAELTERLERRGAADENMWKWCENLLQLNKNRKKNKGLDEGILSLGGMHFPCPLMKEKLEIPLEPPLFKDPAASGSAKPRKNISNATVMNFSKEHDVKRYSLWTKDFSSLYPVFKIPSYQLPI
ncbi:uncharacterized protein LOC131843860 [Achroia grisella]|uniref:uncharacterized protein LOC131843860 n=1 Tax=Achroia grisella TaxID=688607 RepID=UPI0027D32E95|nr:uncharacterized protein LOC131843860 [Achroia grisella]